LSCCLKLPAGTEADLGMFCMFGQTGAPQKGPHGPENVGQQRDIFWPVGTSLWRVATFKSSLGAAQHYLARRLCAPSTKSEIYHVISGYLLHGKFVCALTSENCEGSHIFTEQGLVGFKSVGPAWDDVLQMFDDCLLLFLLLCLSIFLSSHLYCQEPVLF